MAEIKTSVSLVDKMTRPLQAISQQVKALADQFRVLNRISTSNATNGAVSAIAQNNARLAQTTREVGAAANLAANNQRIHNTAMREGSSSSVGLLGKLQGLIAAYMTLQGATQIFTMSDQMTNMRSRIDLMNDGLQTTDELMQALKRSSLNSYSSFKDTTDMVSKLGILAGDAFGSNKEIIYFAEQLNKHFAIAGTSIEGRSAAMLQLTQALGSGVLRGQEFNSILEQAPTVAGAIAKSLGVSIGELRKMAAEGAITTDVIKKGLYSAAEDTDAKFNTMAVTFSDVWQNFKTQTTFAFDAVWKRLAQISNSKNIQIFANGVANVLGIIGQGLIVIVDLVSWTVNLIIDIIKFLKPIMPLVFGITAAFLAYRGALMAVWLWTKIQAAAVAIWGGIKLAIGAAQVALMVMTGAQHAATAATFMFNSAWLACPVTWILLAIVAVLGVVIGLVFYFADSWQEAVGIISGAVGAFAVYFMNQFGYIWNIIASIAEFFVNVWSHPIYSVKKLFANLTENVLDMAISMTRGWDGFATAMVNAIITAVNTALGWWNKLVDALPSAVTTSLGIGKATTIEQRVSITSDLEKMKSGISAWVGEKPSDYWEAPKYEFKSVGGAYQGAKSWGTNKANELSSKLDVGALAAPGSTGTPTSAGAGLNNIAGNTKKIADNTKVLKGTEEELKYLREIGEREAINKFTTAEIKVAMTNTNNINNSTDIDGFISQLTNKLNEALNTAAEGVHI
jgi:tape measure domain-containing protein